MVIKTEALIRLCLYEKRSQKQSLKSGLTFAKNKTDFHLRKNTCKNTFNSQMSSYDYCDYFYIPYESFLIYIKKVNQRTFHISKLN